ncbi:adenosylcobinamide-GDP ribazoletransferase, partial [Bacillus cereus group sp. BC307]|uniref:adenosylcobinamide-GDP ribazoletransferase n=1 Tax=Bacillus cereus group sp. BC307 TaxID=3445319 RepID=UPI003F26AD2F
CAVALVVVLPVSGLAAVGAGFACLAVLHPFARRNFGGMSGDLAGFFLQACELVMLACIVFAAKAVGL